MLYLALLPRLLLQVFSVSSCFLSSASIYDFFRFFVILLLLVLAPTIMVEVRALSQRASSLLDHFFTLIFLVIFVTRVIVIIVIKKHLSFLHFLVRGYLVP
jgi:hypothetical protein